MRHMDLFSGIGGFALAARWVWGAEHEIVTFCEKEAFPRRVLKKHWPDVPCVEDIHTMNGGDYEAVDILTGGFPCQPFSVAGKRRGAEDDRALWPETLRVIQESRPRWFIGENVPGIINMALDDVLASLESSGYATETLIIPACAVNAPHKRERVWIVAHSASSQRDGSSQMVADAECVGQQRVGAIRVKKPNTRQRKKIFARELSTMGDSGKQWSTQPGICGVAVGVSNRVDRLRGLGNAIVPQVAAVIMSTIKEIEDSP